MTKVVTVSDPRPEPASPGLFKRCLAEIVGTFFLTTAALLSPPQLTFAVVGATLLVMAVALGKVSGAHLNPAVTLGLVTARKFPAGEGVAYVAAQLVGAFFALGLGQLLDRRLPRVDPAANAFWFEMLGTALFVFVVVRVVSAGLPVAATALGVGVALTVGVAVTMASSGGVLNPAIATILLVGDLVQGRSVPLLTYLVGPLVAAVIAALLARYLSDEGEADGG